MRLGASIDIAAPRELVFTLVSTPERLPQWNASVARAARLDDTPIALGSRARMEGRVLGATVGSVTEVVQFDPPSRFSSRAIQGPRIQTSFVLEETAGGGTRLFVDVEGDPPGGALGALVAERVLRSDLARSLAQLRFLCEQEGGRSRTTSQP